MTRKGNIVALFLLLRREVKTICEIYHTSDGLLSPMSLFSPLTFAPPQAFNSSVFSLAARPFSDQGKCQTGIVKKELELSAIPASATYLIAPTCQQLLLAVHFRGRETYQARNAANKPNMPPAFWIAVSWPPPTTSGVRRYEIPRRRKVIQTQKKRVLKTTVDFRVQSQRRKVNMNHPWDHQLSQEQEQSFVDVP